jgi:hypothetical protein
LKPRGILQQWVPNTEIRNTQAITRSLLASFPYVKMYQSYEGWGHHFLASTHPFDVPSAEELAARLPARARADLVEWTEEKDPARILRAVLDREVDPRAIVVGGNARVTDDRHYNSTISRRAWSAAGDALGPWAEGGGATAARRPLTTAGHAGAGAGAGPQMRPPLTARRDGGSRSSQQTHAPTS